MLSHKNKNPLPRTSFEREALNQNLSKIGLRFQGWFKKLTIITLLSFTLLGYYPGVAFPTVNRNLVKAETQQQSSQILAQSFPKPVVLPHQGYISTKFSTWHPAIDIATDLGAPIHPITSGVITESGADLFGLGNFVVVDHKNGFKSKYCHMGKIYVKKGAQVTSDNILGEVGLTGRTTGPHTHLEVTMDGKYIDPEPLLPTLPDLPLQALSTRK